MTVGAVIIGRNEGTRFLACLASLRDQFSHVVYVDSGSTDGSISAAESDGLEVVKLDMSRPFTAARARNAGLERLACLGEPPEFVQFIDGDCALVSGWVETASLFLEQNPSVAMVCGRRRERFPHASIYNHLVDLEWDSPLGRVKATGGDVMGRRAALTEVEGFNPALIAGEEPELCFRLRQKGWEIWRLDAEMTEHDAALNRFGQWWTRARRAGHTYAEGAVMYGRTTERYKVRALTSALVWGAVLPTLILMAMALFGAWAFLGFLVYPLKLLKDALHSKSIIQSGFFTLAKFPEAQGAISYFSSRLLGVQSRLIEYK